MPLTPLEIGADWRLEDWTKARDVLNEEIHVDLLSRSSLLGSCHLLLPNPIYSHSSLQVNDDHDVMTVDLTPFPGRNNGDLEFVVWNRRPWGATSVVRAKLVANSTTIPIPEGIEEQMRTKVDSGDELRHAGVDVGASDHR
jgi:hypothetical protein